MSRLLPKLRNDLDIVVSPIRERPGLLLRDPFRYSDAAMVVPPPLVPCLGLFDGAHAELDLCEMLSRMTSRPDAAQAAEALANELSAAGFVDDEVFRTLRSERQEQFTRAAVREAAHAGGGYPDDEGALTRKLKSWIPVPHGPTPADAGSEDIVAIAAPHVTPSGGVTAYGAAYGALGPHLSERTFVILGTSHYGRPNRFGLTRKPFRTPLGEAVTDVDLVDQLMRAAPRGTEVEDYCHAVEHSIEFQVLFLQSLYGAGVRILPVLCGPFLPGTSRRTVSGPPLPERDSAVAAALGALAELSEKHGQRLVWVLGVDMAHMGRRYGDPSPARAHEGAMNDVATRDRERLARVVDGDVDGFWELLNQQGSDDLKWCGSAPIYSFLRACPRARGRIRAYDQWNIDDASVVSFAALDFILRA